MAQVFLYVKFHEDFVGHFLFKRRRYSGELWLREFGVFSSEDRKNPAPGMDDVTISTSYHIWNRIHSAMTEQLMSFSLHIYKRPQQPTPTTQIEGVFLLLISEMNSLELENVPEINPRPKKKHHVFGGGVVCCCFFLFGGGFLLFSPSFLSIFFPRQSHARVGENPDPNVGPLW